MFGSCFSVADKQAAPGLPHRGRLLHRSAITRSPSLNGTDSGAGGAALSTQPRAVPGGLFVLHARSLPDNPYDGHTCGTSSTAPRRSPAVGRCYLKGRAGEAANFVLSAVGHNFRRILAWLRQLLCLFLVRLWRVLAGPAPLNSPS